MLKLIKQRLAAGTASQLEVAQQESLLATQRAAIPPLQQTLKQNRTALAMLVARSPERMRVRGGSLRGIAYPRVTPGLPSELLAQRPDIREAEANLAAANANVANARAQFLPSVTLTAEGGYASARAEDLVPAGIGDVLARRRPDAADLRGRPAAPAISTCKRAGRTNCCKPTANR